MWNVDSSAEYDAWFKTLDEESQIAVLSRVLLLRQYGPQLPRPYADTLKGSKKYKNYGIRQNSMYFEYHIILILKETAFFLPVVIRKEKIRISFTRI